MCTPLALPLTSRGECEGAQRDMRAARPRSPPFPLEFDRPLSRGISWEGNYSSAAFGLSKERDTCARAHCFLATPRVLGAASLRMDAR